MTVSGHGFLPSVCLWLPFRNFNEISMIRICLVCLLALFAVTAAHAASPAEMISQFRAQHGEKAVVTDGKLTRVAQDQAAAMAAKDVLDHDVAGPFGSRVASVGGMHAAENIAYGYDDFPKTLNQWINSSGHRQNLLMHDATRVGVASARSASGKTYWAMAIAGEEERRAKSGTLKSAAPKSGTIQSASAAKPKTRQSESCHIRILRLCL